MFGIVDRKPHLRVKIKSLAEEAKIIRNEASLVVSRIHHARTPEEKQELRLLRDSLHDHRRGTVRSAARQSLLAYAILKGKSYVTLESRCHEPPSFKGVAADAVRFGADKATVDKWVTEAKAHLKLQEHPSWALTG